MIPKRVQSMFTGNYRCATETTSGRQCFGFTEKKCDNCQLPTCERHTFYRTEILHQEVCPRRFCRKCASRFDYEQNDTKTHFSV